MIHTYLLLFWVWGFSFFFNIYKQYHMIFVFIIIIINNIVLHISNLILFYFLTLQYCIGFAIY